MNAGRMQAQGQSRAGSRFSVPSDPSAWWSFAASSAAGMLLLGLRSPERVGEGLLLFFALFCLFLASDWISSLYGKGLRGDVEPGRLLSVQGAGLLLLGLVALGFFWRLQPWEEARFWGVVLACGAGLTFTMFMMRMDLAPDDPRLAALSCLLCSTPALFLGWLAWGERSPEAWAFWVTPAVFFPVSAVFSLSWLQGLFHRRRHFAVLVGPLAFLIAVALTRGADLAALLLTAYVYYIVRRLLLRYRLGGASLPEFSQIRRIGREQAVWNFAAVAAWVLTWALP